MQTGIKNKHWQFAVRIKMCMFKTSIGQTKYHRMTFMTKDSSWRCKGNRNSMLQRKKDKFVTLRQHQNNSLIDVSWKCAKHRLISLRVARSSTRHKAMHKRKQSGKRNQLRGQTWLYQTSSRQRIMYKYQIWVLAGNLHGSRALVVLTHQDTQTIGWWIQFRGHLVGIF